MMFDSFRQDLQDFICKRVEQQFEWMKQEENQQQFEIITFLCEQVNDIHTRLWNLEKSLLPFGVPALSPLSVENANNNLQPLFPYQQTKQRTATPYPDDNLQKDDTGIFRYPSDNSAAFKSRKTSYPFCDGNFCHDSFCDGNFRDGTFRDGGSAREASRSTRNTQKCRSSFAEGTISNADIINNIYDSIASFHCVSAEFREHRDSYSLYIRSSSNSLLNKDRSSNSLLNKDPENPREPTPDSMTSPDSNMTCCDTTHESSDHNIANRIIGLTDGNMGCELMDEIKRHVGMVRNRFPHLINAITTLMPHGSKWRPSHNVTTLSKFMRCHLGVGVDGDDDVESLHYDEVCADESIGENLQCVNESIGENLQCVDSSNLHDCRDFGEIR